MRWMWIDRILECEPGRRIVAVKNVSLAEDYLHDHFEARTVEGKGDTGAPEFDRLARPLMPASLIIEGMAQTAGILVGHMHKFREKVILAKVNRALLHAEVLPGQTIIYEAFIDNADVSGALTRGTVSVLDHRDSGSERILIGEIELIFSHIDQNMSGLQFPVDNFVFTDNFDYVIRDAGLA